MPPDGAPIPPANAFVVAAPVGLPAAPAATACRTCAAKAVAQAAPAPSCPCASQPPAPPPSKCIACQHTAPAEPSCPCQRPAPPAPTCPCQAQNASGQQSYLAPGNPQPQPSPSFWGRLFGATPAAPAACPCNNPPPPACPCQRTSSAAVPGGGPYSETAPTNAVVAGRPDEWRESWGKVERWTEEDSRKAAALASIRSDAASRPSLPVANRTPIDPLTNPEPYLKPTANVNPQGTGAPPSGAPVVLETITPNESPYRAGTPPATPSPGLQPPSFASAARVERRRDPGCWRACSADRPRPRLPPPSHQRRLSRTSRRWPAKIE